APEAIPLNPSDYTLDITQRVNGDKDSHGRFSSWTETTRSSLTPDKVSVTQVNATYQGSEGEFATYDSETVEQGPSIYRVTDTHQKNFIYENGHVVSVDASVDEHAFDPRSREETYTRSYNYVDKTYAFDVQGRATDTERITSNDTQAPAL